MGTWGHGSFENDDALDFLSGLDSAGWKAIEETLQVTGKPDELDGAFIIAASEVVVAINGAPVEDLPESVTKWVSEHRDRYKGLLITETAHAVALVADEDSDLRGLWESTDPGPWLDAVADLQRRLDKVVSELGTSV